MSTFNEEYTGSWVKSKVAFFFISSIFTLIAVHVYFRLNNGELQGLKSAQQILKIGPAWLEPPATQGQELREKLLKKIQKTPL